MKSRSRNGLFVLLVIVLCFGCSNQASYHQYQSLNGRYWEKDAEYFFTFHIPDAQTAYDLSLEIRNNNLYPFQNLWVFWQEELPSGTLRRDTIECMLADDYGKWLGQGVSLFQSSFPLRNHYFFPDTGSYTISFRQGMREEHLPGIQEIGLKVNPSR